MSRLRWFKFYPQEWLTSTQTSGRSLEEVGLYIQLLSLQSVGDILPKSTEKLARLVGIDRRKFERLWRNVSPNFVEVEGGLVNPKLNEIMASANKRSQEQSMRAHMRWGNNPALPAQCGDGNAASSPTGICLIRSKKKEEEENTKTPPSPPLGGVSVAVKASPKTDPLGNDLPDFVRFYAAYPRHVARRAAVTAWRKLNPPPALVETILADVRKRAGSPDWLKDNGAYIPHPATYLNGQRWLDEDLLAGAPVDSHLGPMDRLGRLGE